MTLKRITQLVAAAALISLPSTGLAITSNDFIQLGGVAANDKLGNAVASGDLNGDGYDDLVMGAPNNATAYIAVVYGSATFPTAVQLSTSNSVIITGNGASDGFGDNSIAVGDINGDGYDDVAVGAVGDTTAGGANSGAVYLFYGRAAEWTSAAATDVVGFAKFYHSPGFRTGAAVSFGDLNGDGYDDLLIGSTNDAATGGSVSIVYGQSSPLTGSANLLAGLPKFTGEASGNTFGSAIAMGDLNNDGYDDALIGAPRNNDGGALSGAAYLFYGNATAYTGSTSASTVPELYGEAAGDAAGRSVAIGEVTGDDYVDMLITANGNDDGANNAGAVYLITGSGTTLAAESISLNTTGLFQFTGIVANDAVGNVSAIDLDTDGTKDIVIGAPLTGSLNGSVYLRGGENPVSSSLSELTALTGATTAEKFGTAVGSGDLNGDGFNELFIGANANNSNAGAFYIGVLLLDEDGDGTPGSGLIYDLDPTYTIDCSDSDDTVVADQTYYIDADGDGLGVDTTTTIICSSTAPAGYADNALDTNDTIENNGVEISGNGTDDDGDATIDEPNTISENGKHPGYGSADPTDHADVAANITSVVGAAAGVITVTYADSSVYDYTIFNTTTTKTTLVQQYKDTGYAVVLDRKGKKIKLVNLYNGDIANSKNLSNKSVNGANFLLKDVRKDNTTEAVVTLTQSKKALAYIVKVKISSGKLKVKDNITVNSSKVAVNKTKVKKSKVILRTSKRKTVAQLIVNKNYKFVD